MSEIKDYLLVEKWRPKTVSDIVGNVRGKVEPYLSKPKSLPHFIFYSVYPGTGKTSMAYAIIKDLKCDSLIMNSSDERRIEDIREKVKIFVRAKSSNPELKKCVILEEMDSTTALVQNALRNIMETYSDNAFFIITCNNVSKIIKPIQSRCILVDFSNPEKSEIACRIKKICNEEGIEYEEMAIKQLVFTKYPSIRNMVMLLQELKISNKSLTNSTIQTKEIFEKHYAFLINKNLDELKKAVYLGELNVEEFNNWLFRKFLKVVSVENISRVARIIKILADNEKAFAYGANQNIVFLASLIEIISGNLL